jgi:hypothetical protein
MVLIQLRTTIPNYLPNQYAYAPQPNMLAIPNQPQAMTQHHPGQQEGNTLNPQEED